MSRIYLGSSVPWGTIYRNLAQSLRESGIWESKIWPWIPRDRHTRKIPPERSSVSCKLGTRLLVREATPHQHARNFKEGKIWSLIPVVWKTPRYTGRLAVGWNKTLTWLWNELLGDLRFVWVLLPWGRRMYDVGSRQQATTSDNCKNEWRRVYYSEYGSV